MNYYGDGEAEAQAAYEADAQAQYGAEMEAQAEAEHEEAMNNTPPLPKDTISDEAYLRQRFYVFYEKAIKEGHPPKIAAWTICQKLLNTQAQAYREAVRGKKEACKPTGNGCWEPGQEYCDKHQYYNQAIDDVLKLFEGEGDK